MDSTPKRKGKKKRRVLVIGSGISGLGCARELASRHHYQVLVLEARSRVGGRLKGSELVVSKREEETGKKHGASSTTSTKNNKHYYKYHAVDLGGTLIHGIQDNPLYKLTQDMGVPTQSVQECLLMDDSGWPVDARLDERISTIFNECLEESFARAASSTDGSKRNADTANDTKKRSTRSTTLSPQTSSFGDLFQQVAAEKAVSINNNALLQWHQMNLEISCGAGFDRLGWAWNEDEPFGYDGSHNALEPSWKAVVETLAETLDVWHGAKVQRIQIVHPTQEAIADFQKEQKEELLLKEKKAKTASGTTTATKSSQMIMDASVQQQATRKSRRIRGEDVDVRRSARSNKGAGADRFTIDHNVPQQASSPYRKRSSSAANNSQRPYSYVQVTVQVDNANGTKETFVLEADAVVCTLPLGILKLSLMDDPIKAGGVVFDPPLPTEKQAAVERLGTGLLNKCALSFPHIFWQNVDFLGLALEEQSYLVLNVAAYTGQPVLMFMYGGNFAQEIEQWSDTEIVDDCLNVLKRICGRQPPAPLDYHVTRWGHEEFSRMAFTYVPPGVDGFTELQTMSRPIYDREGSEPILMFAGEHTTPFHPSTIHGAFLSGIREAYRLESALDNLGQLEFTDEELYQRTFLVQRKFEGNGARSVNVTAADKDDKESGPVHNRSFHRRRGAAGVMNFRSDSDHDSSSHLEPPVPLNEGSMPSRRSMRSGASQQTPSKDENGHGKNDGLQTIHYSDIHDLERRLLLRSVESYGSDFDFIHSAVLPIYGKSEEESLTKTQNRCQRILRSIKGGKAGRPRLSWKSWLADAIVPPSNSSKDSRKRRRRAHRQR